MEIIELSHGYFARSTARGLAVCRPPAAGESQEDIEPFRMALSKTDAVRLVRADRIAK